MGNAYDFAEALIPLLKQRGYKKKNLTWTKTNGEVTLLFYLQKSQYSKEVWYYLFAVGINALSEKQISSFEKCHMFFRLDQSFCGHLLTPDDIIEMIDWNENSFNTVDKINNNAENGMLPGISITGAINKELREYLSEKGLISRGYSLTGMNNIGPMEKYKRTTENELDATIIHIDTRQL